MQSEEQRRDEVAVPGGMHESHHRVAVGNDELAVVAVVPDDAADRRIALLLHGGPSGDKDGPEHLFTDLAGRLAQVGIGSVRFDFRGCGDSSGRYRDMTIARQVEDLAAVRHFTEDAFAPASLGVVGESYGATIALQGLDSGYRAVVLLWPAIWLLDETFASYVTAEKLAAAEAEGYIVEDGEEIGVGFLHELLVVRDVAAPLHGLTTPVLFVHGEADTEVPFAQSARAAELVAGPRRLVPVPGGDHCLTAAHERDVVYGETTEWLHEYL